MAGKGRTIVDNKCDNQYQVCLNDEEKQILEYCSAAIGKPKSQIFCKALTEYYTTVRLNEINSQGEYNAMEHDVISMKRVIECLHCGVGNPVNLANYNIDECTKERQCVPKHSTSLIVIIMNA